VAPRGRWIVPRPQAIRFPGAVGIGRVAGFNQTLPAPTATMKGFCLDRQGQRQREPEGYHSCYPPGNAPPAQPPFDGAGMRLEGLRLGFECWRLMLQLLRLLLQRLEPLTKVVHAVHVPSSCG